jgi:hypothetical protein
VDNTSDAAKPVSTATQTALNTKQNSITGSETAFAGWDKNSADDFSGAWAALTGIPAGFSDGVDNVNDADADATNEIQNLSISGTSLSISGGSGVTLAKANVGLGNVDNTSDAAKPVSTATQTALNAKQNTLTAGSGISIVGSTISATGGGGGGTTMTDYSAGTSGTSSCRVRASGSGVTFSRAGSAPVIMTISIPDGVYLESFRIYNSAGDMGTAPQIELNYTNNTTTNQDIATMNPPQITGLRIGASVHSYVPAGLSGAVNLNTRISAVGSGDITIEFSAFTTSMSTGATMLIGRL